MPTSTNVTNLKINELTEAQYDSAVQGGVIGANELSILTDAEVGQVIQVTTLPTASADELDNIYQFVGTTDANYTNGYFYKCVSDGQQPATYSWSRVDVQPAGSSYTAGTGIDITNGTISVTAPTLQNNATGSNSVVVGRSDATNHPTNTVVVGSGSGTQAAFSVAIGYNSSTNTSSGTAIGASTFAMNQAVAIGFSASATKSIQISCGTSSSTTNNDANTFKVANANGNYEMMSADGTIPHARLTNAVQSTTVTIATTDWSSNTASVTVSGLTATSVVWVAPDNASQSAYTTAGVYASAQAADTLTFTCTQTPSASLTINVVFC